MKYPLRHLLIAVVFLLAPISAKAATVYQMTLEGFFAAPIDQGLPGYNVGDAFWVSVIFDDTEFVASESRSEITSVLSSEFRIEGSVVPHGAIDRIALQVFRDSETTAFSFDNAVDQGDVMMLNPSYLLFSFDDPIKFSDVLGLTEADFVHLDFNFMNVEANDGFFGSIDKLTISVIPEPSTFALLGLAGIGLALHFRRSKAA